MDGVGTPRALSIHRITKIAKHKGDETDERENGAKFLLHQKHSDQTEAE
jgi:hypothetical protein